MNAFEIQIVNFQILTTGVDGGHEYITNDIQYGGNRRKLTVFFTDKADEQKIKSLQTLKVTGSLMDEGIQYGLLLLDAKIIDINGPEV